MKKMMIIAALALCAFASQAASVKWTSLNTRDSSGAAAGVGWIVALYDSSTTFDIEKAQSGVLTPVATDYLVTAGATSTLGAKLPGSVATTLSGGQSYSYYAVIYNASTIEAATEYIQSAVVSGSINAAGSDVTIAFGNMTSATSKWAGASWQSAGGGVPEPTSGLLLVLGGAMLALRRRRA